MSKKIRNTEVDHLFDAILTLENKEECYTFFEDVCTVNELLSISQRYEAVSYTHLDVYKRQAFIRFALVKYSLAE